MALRREPTSCEQPAEYLGASYRIVGLPPRARLSAVQATSRFPCVAEAVSAGYDDVTVENRIARSIELRRVDNIDRVGVGSQVRGARG